MALSTRDFIAKNTAALLKNGQVVNLGIGMPTLCTKYVPDGVEVFFQAECGIVGIGAPPPEDKVDKDIVDAGGAPATIVNGGSAFDSYMSFSLIRGGHVDVTVLGAMQVDKDANIANWIVPGKMMAGMGGAMDLVTGCKYVYVAMEHMNAKSGELKIIEKCTLPLTGKGVVSAIITELAVMQYKPEGLTVTAIAPGVTKEDLQSKTGCKLIFPADIPLMLE